MKTALKWVSLAALLGSILPSVFLLTEIISHETANLIALSGTIVWFLITPFWMGVSR